MRCIRKDEKLLSKPLQVYIPRGRQRVHRFRGAPGGGGGRRGTPNPLFPEAVPLEEVPPRRSLETVFGFGLLPRPGILIENVWPSFKE